jgi:hypothetical protein
LEGSAKFGLRRLRNYHANHAIFLRVMIHLKVLKVLKVHLFPRRPGVSKAAKQPTPTRGHGNFSTEGILSDLGTSLGEPLLDVIIRSR